MKGLTKLYGTPVIISEGKLKKIYDCVQDDIIRLKEETKVEFKNGIKAYQN